MSSRDSESKTRNPITIDIEEETCHGIDGAGGGETRPISVDSDSDVSLDDIEDSSCSNDMIQHTVHADLYGTDQDPNYTEELHSSGNEYSHEGSTDRKQLNPEKSSSNTQQPSSLVRSREPDVQSTHPSEPCVVLERLDGHHSIDAVQDLTNNTCQSDFTPTSSSSEMTTRQELGTSLSKIFRPYEPRTVVVGNDIDVFRQSYMPNPSPQIDSNSTLNSPASAQHTQHQEYDAQQQNSTKISASLPIDMTRHEQLHEVKTSYQTNHPIENQQVSAKPQTGCLQNDFQMVDRANAVSFNKPDPESEHSTPIRQKMCLGSDGKQYVRLPASYREGFTEEENIAAEQLASELVKTYGGQNSLMISEMLKESSEGGQETGYVYSGFERPSDLVEVPNPVYNTPQMINDVLNTPNQLSHIGDDEEHGMPGPRVMNYHQGGRWINNNNQAGGPGLVHQSQVFDKYGQSSNGQFLGNNQNGHLSSMPMNYSRSPQFDMNQFSVASRNQYYDPCQSRNASLFTSSTSVGGAYREMGQSTKTTFVSREHMEMHLNDKLKYKVGQNQNSASQMLDINYSSIYPSRDFIERTAGSRSSPISPNYSQQGANQNDQPHSSKRASMLEDNNYYSNGGECRRPLKKRRVSKYSTDELRVPPQTPLYGDVMKYAPVCNREDMQGSRHKYFVVNPSDVTNMSPRALLTKYIDFLIGENEQITEISKSVNPPVDIYVTEDMYFMDSLKFMAPFPSKKFIEWVANFYPRLDLFQMKFKGRTLTLPQGDDKVRVDNRPTEQVLEDTFYFFQREAMGGKK